MEVSAKTAPDEYTGHSLKWLIMHSQKTSPREKAIQAIAGITSEETILPLLEEKQILLQVAQSFTACFTEESGGEGSCPKLNPTKEIETVGLHGQALSILVNYASEIRDPIIKDDPLEQFDKWTLTAVEDRFHL